MGVNSGFKGLSELDEGRDFECQREEMEEKVYMRIAFV